MNVTAYRRKSPHPTDPHRHIQAFSMIALLLLSTIMLVSVPAYAQLPTTQPPAQQTPTTQQANEERGFGLINPLGDRNIPQIIGRVVAWLGTLAGSLFFLFLIWGGIQWMTAGGSEQKTKEAQQRIVASVAGIGIVVLAYFAVAAIIGFIG